MTLSRYEVVPAGTIDSREELIDALATAAELEHLLLVQYLFAAFSLRKRPGPGFDERQVQLARNWEGVLLDIAREEMVHLATVIKLSVAIGGAPHLDRPPLPQVAGGAFPFAMRLACFGPEDLERFIRFETPAVAVEVVAFDLAPDLLEYEYLGEMYQQIIGGFRQLAADHGDEWLFVGPPELRDAEDWGLDRPIEGAVDSEAAVTAITKIIAEGEGGPEDTAGSHYQRFVAIRDALAVELRAQPDFAPARPIVDDPMTRAPADGGGTVLAGLAADVGALFNHLYGTILLLIAAYYAPTDETDDQREQILAMTRRPMSAILRPLGEVLTDLPATGSGDEQRAGAPFEIYAPVTLAPTATARWAVVDERLDRAAVEADRLAAEPQLPRMVFIADNIRLLLNGLRSVSSRMGLGIAKPRV